MWSDSWRPNFHPLISVTAQFPKMKLYPPYVRFQVQFNHLRFVVALLALSLDVKPSYEKNNECDMSSAKNEQ
jgi:hypothetical protein